MAWHQARLRVIAFHLGVQPNGEEITMSTPCDCRRGNLGSRTRNDREAGTGPASCERSAKNTTEVLSLNTVAEVLGISRNGATNKIENCAISERPAWND